MFAAADLYLRSLPSASSEVLFGIENYETATAAHDARNVLASLRLYGDLLAEPGVLAPGREYLIAELQSVASTLSALIERLAEFRSGKCVMNGHDLQTPVRDLREAMQQLSGPLAALAGAKIRFEMECLPCPGEARLSHESLARILFNLTRNAAEAMPHGGRIRITLQQGDGGSFMDKRQSHTALLCVQDSGPGIPDEVQKVIFEAGFSSKTDSATSRGLGLNIVRSLVETAGGDVRVVSAPGRGARFEVELPLIGSAPLQPGFVADFTEMEHVQC
jgi:signal transduction histidine kinase